MQTDYIDDIKNDETVFSTEEGKTMENEEILRLREHSKTLLNEKKEAVKRITELEKEIFDMKAEFQQKEDRFNATWFEKPLYAVFSEIATIPPDMFKIEMEKHFIFKLEEDNSIGWYNKEGERFLYPEVENPKGKTFRRAESKKATEESYANIGKPMPFTREHLLRWLAQEENKHLEERFNSFIRAHYATGGGAPSSLSRRYSEGSKEGDKPSSSDSKFGLK